MRRINRMMLAVPLTCAACASEPVTHPDTRPASVFLQVTSAPQSLKTLRIAITGVGISDSLVYALNVQGGAVADTLQVPPGPARRFLIDAFDSSGANTFRGDTSLNLIAGPNPNLVIVLAPLVASLPISVTFRSCGMSLATDPFGSGRWLRTGSSVTVVADTLVIGSNGAVDDGFVAPCTLSPPWQIDVTGRIISGGQNYVFPEVHVQLSNGWWIDATSLPDGLFGWLLMACDSMSWRAADIVPGHTGPETCTANRWSLAGPASVSEGQFMTIRISTDGASLRLYARPDGQTQFTFVREIPFGTAGLSVRRLGISQPWDARMQVSAIIAQ